jgi:hypothetical protein
MLDTKKIARFLAAAIAVLMLAPAVGSAQAPAPSPAGQFVTGQRTATITAIDAASREVTLTFADGTSNIIQCGPEIQRFNELKVGDKVTFRATAAVVYGLSKQAAPSGPAVATIDRTTSGGKPGGTVTGMRTATVTITHIDLSVPSVTVKTSRRPVGELHRERPRESRRLQGRRQDRRHVRRVSHDQRRSPLARRTARCRRRR